MRVRPVVVAAALGALAACSMFPRQMYPPVARSTPDSVVVAGTDTFHVYVGAAYEVHAPSVAAVDGARRQLDHAATEFRRYFGTTPPRLTVLLFNDRAAFDRYALRPVAARGGPVLAALRPVELQRRAARMGPEELWPLSRDAMRLFYLAHVDAKRRTARADTGGLPVDMRRGHEAMPDWFDEAVLSLGTMSYGMGGGAVLYLQRGARRPIPLAEFLAMPHPLAANAPDAGEAAPVAIAGEPRDGRQRSGPTADRAALFAAQASALAEYLAEKEGPLFIGALADGLAEGATLEELLRQATAVPRDVAALERAWHHWLEEQSGQLGGRRAAPSRAGASARADPAASGRARAR